MRRWRARHPGYSKPYTTAWYRTLRDAVFALLGGRCEDSPCLGGKRLEVHHIFGDGAQHKARVGQAGVWKDILSGAYPRDRVALLCSRCHCRRERQAGTHVDPPGRW